MRRAAMWQGLDLFSQVVEAGSITAAADRLGLSKSSVSTRMTGLEAALGVRLLSRSKTGVHLTEPGRRLLVSLRQLCMN